MKSVFILYWEIFLGTDYGIDLYPKFFTSRETASAFAEQFFSDNKEAIFDWSDEEIAEAIEDGVEAERFTWNRFITIKEMGEQQ
jgi:hypothetical protein